MKKILAVYIIISGTILILSALVIYTTRLEARGNELMLRADRDYWREAAIHPETPCRLKGGQFRWTEIFVDFTKNTETLSYACKEMKE